MFDKSRRHFLSASAGALAAAAELSGRQAKPEKMIGIQVGAVSFVDEGVEPVLDNLQKVHVNTLFLAAFTYGRGIAGRQVPGQPLPNHGLQKYDTDSFHGGSYAAVHEKYFTNTPLKNLRAPDLGSFDMFEKVLPTARKRGIKNIAWFEDVFRGDIPGVAEVQERDLHDHHATTLCFNNPGYRNFLLGLVEDYARSWDLDGIMWGSERQGAFSNALGASAGGLQTDPGKVTCFCQFCQKKGSERGIRFDRVQAGFGELEKFVRAGRAGTRPNDGYYVQLWRLMLNYPELLAWENLWHDSLRDTYKAIYDKVKSVKPTMGVGWHIWHTNSFSPIYRAEQDLGRIAPVSDFLKVVIYDNVAGERLASYIDSVSQTAYGDIPKDELLRFNDRVLGYKEGSYSGIPQTGLGSDYVYRETKRARTDLTGTKTQLWPGIDVDVPTAPGHSKCTPQQTKDAVLAAFRGGADGVILSRKYSEMKLENLAGAGDAIRQLGFALVLLFCLAAFGSIPAWAQADIGQISGTLVDNTKAVVPGVRVTVTNEGNQVAQETTTNNSGYYTFPNLVVGTYTVAAQLGGFQRYVRSGISLNATNQLDISIQLTLGNVTETVQVTETSAPAISLEPSTGGTVTAEQFKQLEVNGRNPIFLALLEPGVVGSSISTFDPDSVSNGGFSINGGRVDAYTVYVDGAMATRTRESGSMLGAQDMNTVQEIQVLTGNFDAQYGRSNAGQIRFVTKSGTTKFHGDAYEVLRNAAFDANSWSRNSSPISRQNANPPKQNYNDFGFDFGGPVFIPGKFNRDRNKVFIFFAEEWVRRRYENDVTGTVPTAAMRTGDLSALLNPKNVFFGRTRVVTDPVSRQPFPGNIIPTSQISQQGAAVLNAYPLPTPGFQQGAANFIATYPIASNLQKTTFKADYYLNDKNHLFVRGTIIPWRFNNPTEGTLGLFQSQWSRPNRTGIVDLTTTFTPTLLNDFSISANSDGKGSIAYNTSCGAFCQRSTYGITYPYLYPGSKLYDQKLPSITVTGLTTIDNGPYPGSWAGFVEDLTDNVTKVSGNHTLMFGGTFEYAGQNDLIQLTTTSAPQTNNQNGAFQFLDSGASNTSGLGIGNALLGNFNSYSEFGAKPETPWVAKSVDLFVQDVWRVKRSLTIHYGVRYSLWPAWSTKNGTIAQFEPQFYNPAQAATVSPTTGFITGGSPYNGIVLPGSGPTKDALNRFPVLSQYSGLYHNLPAGFVPTQYDLFQPRFGLAYQVSSGTVIRLGAGYFADRTAINRDSALGANPPFTSQATLINGNIGTLGSAASILSPFSMTINAPNNAWPTAYDYNATVQHQFGHGVDVSGAYVGNRGLHLQRKRNINQLLPGTTYLNPTINPNALRPYVGAGIINMAENSGSSIYNSLQADARKTTGPLTMSASYTLSHSTDNTSILTDVLPNAYNDRTYWGPSDFDIPQALTVSYVYNLPFRGTKDFVHRAFGDWTISGINQFQSGTPFSVRQNIDYAGVGTGSGNQFWNVTGNPYGCGTSFVANVGATKYCTSAFSAPATGTFATGYNRNAFRNPGYREWNLALHKQFAIPINEGSSIEFRAEAFNVLNHPNWGAVASSPVSSTFMMVTGKTGNRNLQFQLKVSF